MIFQVFINLAMFWFKLGFLMARSTCLLLLGTDIGLTWFFLLKIKIIRKKSSSCEALDLGLDVNFDKYQSINNL